jgi:SAM-dependent methyltransferase
MTRTILHVGCGIAPIPDAFKSDGWHEVRLDLDPETKPDIVASLTDMAAVASESLDAVFCSHCLEHLHAHEVPLALREFFRVLKPGGFVLVAVPDLERVAEWVARGLMDTVLYNSPAGPITPRDMIYGFGPSIQGGNLFMCHKTGFTPSSLKAALSAAGFDGAITRCGDGAYNLWCTAQKPDEVRMPLPDDLSNPADATGFIGGDNPMESSPTVIRRKVPPIVIPRKEASQ